MSLFDHIGLDAVITGNQDVNQVIGQRDGENNAAKDHSGLRNPQRGRVLALTDIVKFPGPIGGFYREIGKVPAQPRGDGKTPGIQYARSFGPTAFSSMLTRIWAPRLNAWAKAKNDAAAMQYPA